MPVELTAKKAADALPIWLAGENEKIDPAIEAMGAEWLARNRFSGKAEHLVLIPSAEGKLAGAVLGIGSSQSGFAPLITGVLGSSLPAGDWYFANPPRKKELACLGALLGGYAFTRYGKKVTPAIRLAVPPGVDPNRVNTIASGIFLARDLVNTPASDMGPAALEKAARRLAQSNDAVVAVTSGEQLLASNFPMIHAVGRAGEEAPRLIDLTWGRTDAPKITLVGKGVIFDTGGLDIKPASSMLLMKKDMGGAANVLGLASMIMASDLDIRLRVLIPAVENAISGNAFRPGDILHSRAGLTVEIGNTDAEGRLVLADALACAVEEDPDLVIDMATLTGAARVAMGPDIVPFYCDNEGFAAALEKAADKMTDPIWRMPLWPDYESKLSSGIADTNNVTGDSFAGSITAALFLKKFAGKARCWAHFDIFAWNPGKRAHGPAGGEAQAIRAIFEALCTQYRKK